MFRSQALALPALDMRSSNEKTAERLYVTLNSPPPYGKDRDPYGSSPTS